MSRYVCYYCTLFSKIQLCHSSKVLFLTLMELPSKLRRAPYIPMFLCILSTLCKPYATPVHTMHHCVSFAPVLHLLHPYAPISSVYTHSMSYYTSIPHDSCAPFCWLRFSNSADRKGSISQPYLYKSLIFFATIFSTFVISSRPQIMDE